MKATPIDLPEAFANLPPVAAGTPPVVPDEVENAFAMLSEFGNGGVFATSFSGKTPWERHRGDELVLVIEGQGELILLIDDEEERRELSKGQLIIVPEKTWHRFETTGLQVLGVTPQPTETSAERRPQT
ncbi:MAG: cupin domain-containing protein [Actinomycetota bacterium]